MRLKARRLIDDKRLQAGRKLEPLLRELPIKPEKPLRIDRVKVRIGRESGSPLFCCAVNDRDSELPELIPSRDLSRPNERSDPERSDDQPPPEPTRELEPL
jgi:hypothetical protein